MNFERQTSRTLHDEHDTTLALMGRFEQALLRAPRPPAPADAAWERLARDAAALLDTEVGRHFDFEEQSLFPRLDDAGESNISSILRYEHDLIREGADTLVRLLRESWMQPMVQDRWDDLRNLGLEIVERMVVHIQKEEMALLPAIEVLVSEADDDSLMNTYAAA